MCSYSNLSKSIGRLLVQKSQQSLSLHTQVCSPCICTYARLLGPCFKTGRVKPFCHHLRVKERTRQRGRAHLLNFPGRRTQWRDIATRHEVFNPEMSSTRCIRSPVSKLPFTKSFPQLKIDVDRQGKKHHAHPDQGQLPGLHSSNQLSP